LLPGLTAAGGKPGELNKNKETTLKPPSPSHRPGLWGLFLTFLSLGIQSFGGGSSTFFLIHQVCIERGWFDEEEFVRTWALVQISPGINLLKLTMIIGQRLRGWPGLISTTAGLLIPSGVATALMTAGFALIRDQPVIRAVMKGVLPATIGLSLAMIVQMGQPIFLRVYREGPARMGASLFVLAGAGLLLAVWNVSPVLVLVIAGGVTVGLMAVVPSKAVEKLP
jgi:chromate transporter